VIHSEQSSASNRTSRRHLIVGVDGSESSIDALGWARRIAVVLDAEIDAVTAWHYPATDGFSYAAVDWDPSVDAAGILADALRSAFGEDQPAGLRAVVTEGHPAKVLLDASADAEMLVVGSRGHGGFAGMLLGSVSSHCAEHATCPVLVAHRKP
jgi:nucleotide-binding universal stress UspA family protein